MNTLASAVPLSLRNEVSSTTGFTLAAWQGQWNDQNQFGLDLDF